MSPITVHLEVDSAEEAELLRHVHGLLLEMKQLALSAPAGRVLDVCEAAVLAGGQRVSRQMLEQVLQQRIEALEKKGRPCVPAAAAAPARIAAQGSDRL